MPATRLVNLWRFLWPVLPPILLCGLAVLVLREPVAWWLHGDEKFDQEAMIEWIREARPGLLITLPELVRQYRDKAQQLRQLSKRRPANGADPFPRRDEALTTAQQQFDLKKREVEELLGALGNALTKVYPGQLPLFPMVFRLTVEFADDLPPIIWDSDVPRQEGQFRRLTTPLLDEPTPIVTIEYQLHAYTQRQARERQEVTRRLWLSGLGIFAAVLALVWIYVAQRRERERQRHRAFAEHQVSEAERRRLEEALRRQEAERQKEEAERQALELKSQLFANIGIMAGSYAHNIKNLLVRPNDLLRRCLEDRPAKDDEEHMLHEVRQTLGTVTERLQQILRTVNRDPTQSERVRLDLNALVAEIHRTWSDLARERWKLALALDLGPRKEQGEALPLWIEGDPSHLQQVLENLLTNARDATFEMRNHLREQARRGARNGDGEPRPADAERRQALIAAAAWKGEVILRTRRQPSKPQGESARPGDQEDYALLEVQDNGIGMSEEVRRRCTETHFSTKRNNALFAGLSAGMGLGLSFVTVILEHHGAALEIDSAPLQGATFRVRFPLAE